MVISHIHRYLFIETPLTASWAIRNELCEYYGGEPILHKHAAYPEFRKVATREEKSYFVFATVRNPLDKLVSRYFKLKTDHRGAFSDLRSLKSLQVDHSDLERFRFIKNSDATFESFFSKYCKRPYSDLVDISSDKFDFVIRYERLQEEFAQVLNFLQIEQVRAIPLSNKTEGKKSEWTSYYTLSLVEQAKKVCGPFMQKWGYEFPPGWGSWQASWHSYIGFRLAVAIRSIYSLHFRYNDGAFARVVRRLRASLVE